MVDFEMALKGKIPFIGVHTDDPVHVLAVLKRISGKEPQTLPTVKAVPVGDKYIYYTEDLETITTEMYRKLSDTQATCVVINPKEPNSLVFDAGTLPTPLIFYTTFLDGLIPKEMVNPVVQVLKGLSTKAAQDVCRLTMARTGALQPNEIRKTRQMLSGQHPGLTNLDTSYDFYEWPKDLEDWVKLNDPYFLEPTTPAPLVPRGILLKGARGTGKSTAALVLGKHWDVPVFRLDISSTLTRWLGEAEGRLTHNLGIIEKNAPCIWLFDEVEKIFGGKTDEATMQRMLSQFLWWLQFHTAKVITVMTSNDIKGVPEELYRPGRIDRVIEIPKLKLGEAKLFAMKVYQNTLGKDVPLKRQKAMRDAIDKLDVPSIAHSDVRQLVYDMIKQKNWLKEGEDG